MSTTTAAACDHSRGVCHGDDADSVCSVEQLARLGEGRHPANMQTLQTRFAARLRAGYADINTDIRRLVGEEDIFGLGDDRPSPPDVRAIEDVRAGDDATGTGEWTISEQLAPAPSPREFDRLTASERHERFVDWLERAQRDNVVGPIVDREGRFIERAYESGTRNGETFIRRSGRRIPPGVDVTAHGPIERRVIERLYTRSYEDARGVGADVSRDISRVISAAYANNYGPERTARELTDRVDSVGKHQSTLIARTTLMEAHNEAALATYETINANEVDVITAIDACDICRDIASDNPHSLEKAWGLVPGKTHPQCRCTLALPEV